MNRLTLEQFSKMHDIRMRTVAKFIDDNIDELEEWKKIRFTGNIIKSEIRNVLDVFEREHAFGDYKFNVDYEIDIKTHKYRKNSDGKRILFIEKEKFEKTDN